jgi:general secretion pathway protein J
MNRAARGFTLLEVLVAVAIFAVLSTLAYAGLTHMLEGRDRIEAERERWRALALAFAQLEDDLALARMRGVRDVDGSALPAFRGQPVDPRPLGDPSLEFTRGGVFVSGDGATTDLQRVAYRLTDSSLMRLTWPTLDRPPGSQAREIPLLSNVDNLTLRLHAPNGAWSDRWPTGDDKNAMPDAVELAFDMTGIGRLTRVFLVNQ